MQEPSPPDTARDYERNLRILYPRDYQRWGYGASLFNGGGALTVSVDRVLASHFQASVQVGLVPVSAGANLRFIPFRDGSSPFVGLGGSLSTMGMGMNWPRRGAEDPEEEQSVFKKLDRVMFTELGWQWCDPDQQFDLGVAFGFNRRDDRHWTLVLMPIISLKFFPGVVFWD